MYEQFATLTAKIDFQMKLAGRGRSVCVKVGDKFSVTNPKHMQYEGVKVGRSKTARLNEGYILSIEQINQLFTVEQ